MKAINISILKIITKILATYNNAVYLYIMNNEKIDTFKQLVEKSHEGIAVSETQTKHFDIEIHLNWNTATIHVRYFPKGSNQLDPYKKEIFRSLTGSEFFGTVSMEDKYLDIITQLQ